MELGTISHLNMNQDIELAVRFTSGIKNGDEFFTDLNGFQVMSGRCLCLVVRSFVLPRCHCFSYATPCVRRILDDEVGVRANGSSDRLHRDSRQLSGLDRSIPRVHDEHNS